MWYEHAPDLQWHCAWLQARLKNPKNEDLWLAAVRTEQRAGNSKAADALMAKVPLSTPYNPCLWWRHGLVQHDLNKTWPSLRCVRCVSFTRARAAFGTTCAGMAEAPSLGDPALHVENELARLPPAALRRCARCA